MNICRSILMSLIIIALASCSSMTNSANSPSISTPDIGIEIQNSFLEITAPDGWNSFKTDEAISLEVRNISKYQITSGPDFSARIFVLADEKWIEVKNKARYQYQLFTLEPTKNYDPLKTVAIGVRPDLSDYSVTTNIRIFLIGTLMDNGKESKKVASFIDLILKP